jgi:acetylornithine deacetylase
VRSDLASLARRLIAADTTSTRSNLPVLEPLADRLDALGFRAHLQSWTADGVAKANLVAVAGPPAPGGLIVCGHGDTVPWEGQPGWTRDPLELEIGEERVFGRGTSDMKVFLAQAVTAAGALDLGRLRRPLVFAVTADEEIGCIGAARLAPELVQLVGEDRFPHLCWIGEPTSWEVFHVHKSVTVFDVTIRGRGGHSGLPSLGVSAIAVAGKVVEVVCNYQRELRERPSAKFRESFPEAPYSTINLGTIRGGTVANVIPEECVLRLSTRGLPDRDPLEIRNELACRLATLDARDPAFPAAPARVEVGAATVVPAMSSPRGTALEQALRERLGKTTVRGSLLAADGCRFAPLGIASLISGPGDFGEAHQPNESISRKAFEEGAEVVRSVVERICST